VNDPDASSDMTDNPAHRPAFQKWMAGDGYAAQTQHEYPYFLGRYADAFKRPINERTLRNEADVQRVIADVYRAIERGGRGGDEFNEHDVKRNLRGALRLYARFVHDTIPVASPNAGIASDVPTDGLTEPQYRQVTRLIRDTKVVKRIKSLYGCMCQLCGNRLQLSPGRFYAEGHHLKPLGKPHYGADKNGNVVCVCPNCHVLLDYNIVTIGPHTLKVRKHVLGREFVSYHNRQCAMR
jgi:predicted restriction endonuclease